MRCSACAWFLIAVHLSVPIAHGGWTIDNPSAGTNYAPNNDVVGDGQANGGDPTRLFRMVQHNVITGIDTVQQQGGATRQIDPMMGYAFWATTLAPPAGGWPASGVNAMGMPIADYRVELLEGSTVEDEVWTLTVN